MSLCRFSSDNFGCDLYIYHDGTNYVMHLAGNRVVGDVPKLAPLFESESDVWMESYKAQMAFLETAKRQRIELPHAGDCLTFEEPEELKAKLTELRGIGYRFPDYVFEEVEDDMTPQPHDPQP